MTVIKIVPMPGPGGSGGNANIADFVFSVDDDGAPSRMTVTDHDMTIETVRDEDSVGSDCDININAADDVFIRSYGDEIGIYASSEVTIQTNSYDGSGNSDNEGPVNGVPQAWNFRTDGRIEFPDGTLQTTGNIRPAADFLTWGEGTTHLPDLNTHFGWNSNGLWFQNSQGSSPITSYPIFTDFTIPDDSSVVVEFIFDANTECNNIGVCVYSDGDNPEWDYTTNSSRIAAQFDCFDLKLFGRNTSEVGEVGIPGTGLYRVRFAYDPTASTDKVTVSYTEQGSEEVIESLSINEALPAGPYRIGFAADQDSSSTKTYMTYLSIAVENADEEQGNDIYGAELDTGNSGTISDTDLVLPVAIKDDSGDDLIVFEKSYTGTARIVAPQDDLALRSARDILLYAGEEGPGNVYIGWGDADMTPDSNNRVATLGDIGEDTSFTVAGGTLGTQPTFNGAPLFTGSYVKAGAMVHFRVDVDFDNILTFGTGQYYINLPFTPKYNYMFTGGCLHDASTGITYVITGHVFAGNPEMRLESTDNSGNTSYNIPFTATAPIALATADNFHIYGDYIAETINP